MKRRCIASATGFNNTKSNCVTFFHLLARFLSDLPKYSLQMPEETSSHELICARTLNILNIPSTQS